MKQRQIAQLSTIDTVGPWDLQRATRLENGYDCLHKAGVINGRYAPCYTSLQTTCSCYGCNHHKEIPGIEAQIVERRRGSSLYLARSRDGIRRKA